MSIVKHQTTKICGEIKNTITPPVEVKNNITITKVEEDSLFKSKESKALKIHYTFTSKYNNEQVVLEVKGFIIYLKNNKEAEEILSYYKEKNLLPEDVMLEVGNFALFKAQMLAISLAKDLEIQSPVLLPRMEKKE